MNSSAPKMEFRLPIAPRPAFYHRIRFFCAALRRLGAGYEDAPVRVTVGDCANLDRVRADNGWAEDFPLEWHRVPDELVQAHQYFGTSDYRYLLPESDADLIILADADTVLLRPLGETFDWMRQEQPCIAGHMAHAPPPCHFESARTLPAAELWPYLFGKFSIVWPNDLKRYSMDTAGRWPPVPSYYNLGFVVLNRAALDRFRESLAATRDRLNALLTSEMRCQIACTLISYQHGMLRRDLPAIFNATNDEIHLKHNQVELDQIKVIHYLRRKEIDREDFLAPESRSHFFAASLQNPVNRLLQGLAREIIGPDWQMAGFEGMICE